MVGAKKVVGVLGDQFREEQRLIIDLDLRNALEFVLRIGITCCSDRANPVFRKVSVAGIGFTRELIKDATTEITASNSVLWKFEKSILVIH